MKWQYIAAIVLFAIGFALLGTTDSVARGCGYPKTCIPPRPGMNVPPPAKPPVVKPAPAPSTPSAPAVVNSGA